MIVEKLENLSSLRSSLIHEIKKKKKKEKKKNQRKRKKKEKYDRE